MLSESNSRGCEYGKKPTYTICYVRRRFRWSNVLPTLPKPNKEESYSIGKEKANLKSVLTAHRKDQCLLMVTAFRWEVLIQQQAHRLHKGAFHFSRKKKKGRGAQERTGFSITLIIIYWTPCVRPGLKHCTYIISLTHFKEETKV